MKIQVSNTDKQTIKSNNQGIVYFSIEDLKFQHLVLEAGIEYIENAQKNVRTKKEFNSLETKRIKLFRLKVNIGKTIKNLEKQKH